MASQAAVGVRGQEIGLSNDCVSDLEASRLLGIRFDRMTSDIVLDRVFARPPELPFAYIVTINADHFLFLNRNGPELRNVYEQAWISVCDSKILKLLARRRGHTLDVVTGSDLTMAVLARISDKQTPITIIGGAEATIAHLRERFGLQRVAHHNPPMGFIKVEANVAACVAFVAAHPAQFVFLCVGAPQAETLASHIAGSHGTSGIGLCVGAAIEFAAGTRQRAPRWMQQAHLEWLFRLSQEPQRLWRRYLLGAWPLLMLMRRVEPVVRKPN